ncbi:MAG: hypothetical protein KAT15_06395 [Bacteroidales bacterium]|nr:hypothetical protein [Bacteroidales bacterium]
MTRNTISLIATLIVLSVMLLVFTDPWSILRQEGRQITLQDPAKIDRIVLSGYFDSTLLVRKGNAWYLPGEEMVNPVTVENLLYAAERLQINSIDLDVRQWNDGMLKSVMFYNGEKPMLRFEMKSRGDQLLVRPLGVDRIFSVSLPGYAGLDLDRVFSSSANHYREHLLIDLLPSDILHIEVERKGQQPFRFTMEETGEISCMLPRCDSTLPHEILDDLSIRLLFSYFTSIRYEEKAGTTPGTSSPDEPWLARLYVESRQGEKHSLRVYSLPDDSGSGTHMFRALVIHNDDPGALVVNYIYLDVLMRDLSHYFAGSG